LLLLAGTWLLIFTASTLWHRLTGLFPFLLLDLFDNLFDRLAIVSWSLAFTCALLLPLAGLLTRRIAGLLATLLLATLLLARLLLTGLLLARLLLSRLLLAGLLLAGLLLT
jgi:hypothetical protein